MHNFGFGYGRQFNFGSSALGFGSTTLAMCVYQPTGDGRGWGVSGGGHFSSCEEGVTRILCTNHGIILYHVYNPATL
jgi:hypothetical protein